MRRRLVCIAMMGIAMLLTAGIARAQGAKQGPEVMRDPDVEKESLHNLDVARQYFKLKKAYVASLKRCEEIIAGNPNFAKIDETLFIAGMSDYFLSKNQGKQKPTLTPEKYRQEAREYLSQLVNDHPDS